MIKQLSHLFFSFQMNKTKTKYISVLIQCRALIGHWKIMIYHVNEIHELFVVVRPFAGHKARRGEARSTKSSMSKKKQQQQEQQQQPLGNKCDWKNERYGKNETFFIFFPIDFPRFVVLFDVWNVRFVCHMDRFSSVQLSSSLVSLPLDFALSEPKSSHGIKDFPPTTRVPSNPVALPLPEQTRRDVTRRDRKNDAALTKKNSVRTI